MVMSLLEALSGSNLAVLERRREKEREKEREREWRGGYNNYANALIRDMLSAYSYYSL